MKSLATAMRSVLLSIAEMGPPGKFPRNSNLFHQHDHGTGVFLIESGLLKLTRTSASGRKLILSVVGPNQLVGEESLVPGPNHYLSNAVCLTDVTGYQISIEAIQTLITVPEFASSFVNYILSRDHERIQRIEMLALFDVEQRVLHTLAGLASLVQPNSDGSTFTIPITQVDLANLVGATRETTCAALSNLQTRHLVVLGRRLLTTAHPNTLLSAANDRFQPPRAASSSLNHN